MSAVVSSADTPSRLSKLDLRDLSEPVAVIFNANAGTKLGMVTNASGQEALAQALEAAGVRYDLLPTEAAGHATVLARNEARDGRKIVVAAGGDGTVGEVAQGLAHTDTVLGVMPLGSIMNVARTLCIPRDLEGACHTIARGQTLAIDLGKIGDRYFLEAAGVGLDAGLMAFVRLLDGGAHPRYVLRSAYRFLRGLGQPRLVLTADGRHMRLRAPMVAVANAPYVGAAYLIAPDARVDDGLLDLVIFRDVSLPRLLLHLALIAGGRRGPLPSPIETQKVRTVEIAKMGRKPLPVHADGLPAGSTPAHIVVAPAALRVLIGEPSPGGSCAWAQPPSG